jgi:glycosyltransferase involved in cell wall biosynthesis
MAVMQAMAAGKAVVSTDAGGVRYLVEHGQSGLVVPPNDEEALADALYQVMNSEAKLEAMGRRGREIARQRFHTDVVAAKTRDVYYRILQ